MCKKLRRVWDHLTYPSCDRWQCGNNEYLACQTIDDKEEFHECRERVRKWEGLT